MFASLISGAAEPDASRVVRKPLRTLYSFGFGRNMMLWSTEASATLFVQGSSRICGRSPFIPKALSRLQSPFMERGKMLNFTLVP